MLLCFFVRQSSVQAYIKPRDRIGIRGACDAIEIESRMQPRRMTA